MQLHYFYLIKDNVLVTLTHFLWCHYTNSILFMYSTVTALLQQALINLMSLSQNQNFVQKFLLF
jgi:hypothetical protein